uniref:VASt domain-containing protein n=1 Tax=Acrobeloides nanus TaxID=290746 RepID=A0A914E3K8_9BILA
MFILPQLAHLITKRPMPEVGLPDSEYPIHGDTASEASGSGSSTTSSVHISENEEPVTCPCVEHKGRPLLDEEYPLAVEQMFVLLFTENPWLKTFSESVRRSEMVYEPWRKGDEPGARIRNYSYRMELTQSFGPKFTNITEIQICTEIGTSGEGYVISKEACNSGIPYADSFSVNCTYCLTRVSPNSCRLRVHGGMVYKKSIFMGIKGIIERSTTNGLEEYYKALNSALSSETDNLSQVIQQRVEDGFETEIYDADSRIATLTHANHVQPISNHFVNNSLSTTLDKTSPVSNAVSNYDLSQLELLNSINTTLRIIAFLLAILAMSFIFSLFWRSSNVTERNLYCGKDFEQLQESLVNLVRHDPSHNFNEIKSLLHSIHEKLYRSQ